MRYITLPILTVLLALASCGGAGSGGSIKVGQFIDDPVSGLSYSCTNANETIAGITDDQGNFNYLPGQNCTFNVGNITLGSLSGIPSDGKVTPQDLAGVSRAATAAPSALAIAQFLQSLNDGTKAGKIVIPAATSTAFNTSQPITLVSSSGVISQSDLQNIVTNVGKALVSASNAKGALDAQIASGNVDKSLGSVGTTAPVVLNSIAVTSSTPSSAAGFTEALTAIGFYSDGSSKDITSTVSWSSSDTSLVSIDSKGLAKGLKKGAVNLTASLTPQGSSTAIKGSVIQTTTDPVLQFIAVTNTANPPSGLTDQLKATGTYSDGSTLDLTKSATWASSDNKTVTVDSNGLAKGLVKGSATIMASFTPSGSSTAIAGNLTETVTDPTALNIVISYVQSGVTTINNAASTALQAVLNFSNTTSQIVSSAVNWVVTTLNSGGNATVAVNSQANTATITGTSVGTVSTNANYLGLTSNSLGLTIAPITLTGTASVGAPMANANILIQDSNGKSLSATTDKSGKYSFDDISSLTLPVVVAATGNVGGLQTTYSSVAIRNNANSIVTNVSPLTDAIVFQVTGQSPANLINSPKELSKISSNDISDSSSNVASGLSKVLEGLQTGASKDYNPITTAYKADGISPFDKLLDFVGTYPSSSAGTTSININIFDKSGDSESISIASGSTNTLTLNKVSSETSKLDIAALLEIFSKFNNAVSTSSKLDSSEYEDLLSEGYIRNGSTKTQWLTRTRDSTSPSYALRTELSNPVINSCSTNKICNASYLVKNSLGTVSQSSGYFLYNSSLGKWQLHGNQAPDLISGFQTYAMYWQSADSIRIGVGWGIRSFNNLKSNNPYNSGVVKMQDSAGNIDAIIYFVSKPNVGGACDKSSSSYWGLLIANISDPSSKISDTTCQNWLDITDETDLNLINKKIVQGGYKMVVDAYKSSNWTGTVATIETKLTTPFLTSKVINKQMFPKVSVGKDATGAYVKVSNAQDYLLVGSFCMSTVNLKGCDMVDKPADTYFYNGSNVAFEKITYAPSSWPKASDIQSFYINAQDKYGRNLRVTQ